MAKLEYLKDGYRVKAGQEVEVNVKAQVDYLVKHKIAKVVDEKAEGKLAIEGKDPREPHTQEAPKPESMTITTATAGTPEESKPSKPIAAK